jgi:DNA helicase IV
LWRSKCGGGKKAIELYGKQNKIYIVNNPVKEEHEDNRRFLKDIEEWIQIPIIEAKNKNFPDSSIVKIFDKQKYMSGIGGAPCTA